MRAVGSFSVRCSRSKSASKHRSADIPPHRQAKTGKECSQQVQALMFKRLTEDVLSPLPQKQDMQAMTGSKPHYTCKPQHVW